MEKLSHCVVDSEPAVPHSPTKATNVFDTLRNRLWAKYRIRVPLRFSLTNYVIRELSAGEPSQELTKYPGQACCQSGLPVKNSKTALIDAGTPHISDLAISNGNCLTGNYRAAALLEPALNRRLCWQLNTGDSMR